MLKCVKCKTSKIKTVLTVLTSLCVCVCVVSVCELHVHADCAAFSCADCRRAHLDVSLEQVSVQTLSQITICGFSSPQGKCVRVYVCVCVIDQSSAEWSPDTCHHHIVFNQRFAVRQWAVNEEVCVCVCPELNDQSQLLISVGILLQSDWKPVHH